MLLVLLLVVRLLEVKLLLEEVGLCLQGGCRHHLPLRFVLLADCRV